MKSERAQSWQRLLIEKGYTARTIPKEYGGHGGEPDIIKARIIGEEFARSQTPAGLGGQGISVFQYAALRYQSLLSIPSMQHFWEFLLTLCHPVAFATHQIYNQFSGQQI